MSLNLALNELKDMLENQKNPEMEEKEIRELENKHDLNAGTLVFYYNTMLMAAMKQNNNQAPADAKKVNRKWTKPEMDFMFHYIKERQDEGALNITEILDEIAQFLNRGYQSVNYKYYTLSKIKEKKQKTKQQNYEYTTISEQVLPVVATEVVGAPVPEIEEKRAVTHTQLPKDGDLLDILSGLISNIEQLPGINLNELLRSLYELTNLALMNQKASAEIESIKASINSEKEELREKLRKREQQLMQEKKRNNHLQDEVAKLAKEIQAFNSLGDAAKIQNLKSYSQRLDYIIDSSGVVLKVGS